MPPRRRPTRALRRPRLLVALAPSALVLPGNAVQALPNNAVQALPNNAVQALPNNVEKIDSFRGIDQYRLKSNGMTILLVPDHTSPVFTFMVVYHVRSRHEAPRNTRSAP